MSSKAMASSARAAAELMAQVLRATSSLAFSDGLNPAQWSALRYFAQTPADTSSVVAFARYHGTTKGTASQTIAALLKKGLLDRQRSNRDRRTVHLIVTPQGRTVLDNDPLNELAFALDTLTTEHLDLMAVNLRQVFEVLGERRSRRTRSALADFNDEAAD